MPRSLLVVLCSFVALPAARAQAPNSARARGGVEHGESRLQGAEDGDAFGRARAAYEAGDYDRAIALYVAAARAEVAQLRQLRWRREVRAQSMDPPELHRWLLRKMREEIEPSDAQRTAALLRALGWARPGFDFVAAVRKLYESQIAGLYDPKTKVLYVVRPSAQRAGGWVMRLLGGGGLSAGEYRLAVVHELAHALVDQHHDLQRLIDAVADHDDRSLALQALVEGDASVVMLLDAMKARGLGPVDPAALDAGVLRRTFRLLAPLLGFVVATGGDADAFLANVALFPYLEGTPFVLDLIARGGWKRVDAAFDSPPASTEQVLHPAKYLEERDDPVDVHISAPKAPRGSRWKLAGRGVAGEYVTGLLVRNAAAAEGWGGDEWVAYDGPGGAAAVVWRTQWDDEAAARRFFAQVERLRRDAHGGGQASHTETGRDRSASPPDEGKDPGQSAPAAGQGASRSAWTVLAVRRAGRGVAVVAGWPSFPLTETAVRAALAARVRPAPSR